MNWKQAKKKLLKDTEIRHFYYHPPVVEATGASATYHFCFCHPKEGK